MSDERTYCPASLRPCGLKSKLLLSLSAFILSLVLAELALRGFDRFFSMEPQERIEGGLEWEYSPDLGYAPKPGSQARTQGYYDDKMVYDVTYTINDLGLRITPSSKSDLGMIFFGGSFTFGDGVNDEESIPYQVGVMTGDRYRVFNLSYSGYGPHQMLSSLENNLAEKAVGGVTPAYIVYQALPYHVMRAVGMTEWGPAGPRYRLVQGEGLVRDGLFQPREGKPGSFKSLLCRLAHKSAIGDRLLKFRMPPTMEDMDLMVSIVSRSKALCSKVWPECEFHVLIWPYRDMDFKEMEKRLRGAGIQTHLVADILPEYASLTEAYVIEYDEHPNAHACNLIAKYIVDQIAVKGGLEKSGE